VIFVETAADTQWFLVNDQRDAQFFSMYLLLFFNTLVIYQESLHDARSTKYLIKMIHSGLA